MTQAMVKVIEGEPHLPKTNAFTVDVEDYFQVSAFSSCIERSDWANRECRVERNVDRILSMLDVSGIKATFFTLGWIAERYPGLVRQISNCGHEIASHGYEHIRVSDQTPDAFLSDIRRAKHLLEDIAGTEVKGYRAPSFSIGRENLWAFECLGQTGYRYSSSIYPITHDHYGMPEAPRFAHQRNGVVEIPATTLRFANKNWPASGGGYFRLFPYAFSKWMLKQVNEREGESAVFYFHPWEIDEDQPRIAGISARARFRHYVNIPRMESRLLSLISDFKWGRMDHIYLDGKS